MNTFQGKYTVADGYANQGSRPHTFTFYSGDLEDGMTDTDLENAYEQAVQDHFEQHITPEPDRLDEFKAWARKELLERS
jgi:hypothetical protein